MSTPLSASYRIDFPYTVSGFTHHSRHYLSATPGSGVSGYDAILRDGTTGVDCTTIADAYWAHVGVLFKSSETIFGQPTLEHLSGISWLPIAVLPTVNQPTASSAYVPAEQLSVTLRDSAFHKVRDIILEANESAGMRVIPPGGDAWSTFFDYYSVPGGGGSTHGYNWMRGRSNLYVTSVVSLVTDLNNKLRRRRGIA
jgi:hypothetical protein